MQPCRVTGVMTGVPGLANQLWEGHVGDCSSQSRLTLICLRILSGAQSMINLNVLLKLRGVRKTGWLD